MNVLAPILLVEDNEDDVFLMKRALKQAHIPNALQIVTDGQQAIDYLAGNREYHNRSVYPLPGVIFLDLKLPYVDGFDVLTWFRAQSMFPEVPVIVLTSSAENRDQQRAAALGARSYMIKPPTPQQLRDILTSLQAALSVPSTTSSSTPDVPA